LGRIATLVALAGGKSARMGASLEAGGAGHAHTGGGMLD